MNTIFFSDAAAGLRTLPAESVDTCITSPPYYGLPKAAGRPLPATDEKEL